MIQMDQRLLQHQHCLMLLSGLANTGNVAAASAVGKEIARLALDKGLSSVVFDRNGFLYHGRIKALADAAREAGLIF